MSSASICVSSSTAAACRSGARRRERFRGERRRHLALEPLQGPVAAALHGGRHARQRDDRADLLALAGELERRHVVLDAVVVRGQRRRALSWMVPFSPTSPPHAPPA